MPFDAVRLLLSRSVIEREGVAPDDATRLAIVPSMLNAPLVTSVVVASAIGRRGAPPPAPPAPRAGGGDGDGGGDGGGDGDDTTVEVPAVVEKRLDEAVDVLIGRGLVPRIKIEAGDGDPQVVIRQDPEAGKRIEVGDAVTIIVPRAQTDSVTGARSVRTTK